jgi:CheY-like chemotaxis protein
MRILIVDDWPDGAESWAILLRSVGMEADAATTSSQAMQMARVHRPDVGILDLNMPATDGYELARRLRRLYPDRLKLIAISGYDYQPDKDRKSGANFDLVLTKPADPSKVLSLLG